MTLALLLGLAAVPGVQAEDEPIQITGLEQLDGIQSGSYQLAANLTIPEKRDSDRAERCEQSPSTSTAIRFRNRPEPAGS